jgi:hypothetical protein
MFANFGFSGGAQDVRNIRGKDSQGFETLKAVQNVKSE